ncbi:endonuclease/exonuclease/phosphatase family protein [Nonomuraea muscovyensis]|uniref:Endonuclease/exonuclease/phosphatase family metal-dependent hydrolase n=1 Tax=Nonomuraea muscovyensis TaxID=1124761 RepID=A0A7X0BZ85_9ACTN|nr:endonuclease/exonuclease/phosphatase family protein [Nonomuraea muscovyensis]MBB6344216.1 endonuclease/exonuclease/phosphatase family metal-dependent hydrolase [Nonomuraea muscovyensis]
MIRYLVIAGLLSHNLVVQAPVRHVMTWNVCAGTNSGCPLFRRSTTEVAWHVAVLATKADVVFLQEFCTGADADLERELEARTGRAWSVKSAGLTHPDGSSYLCHPDWNGRPRGVQSVTLAVAEQDARFDVHALTSPPWSARRYAVCTADRAFCTSHFSSGAESDDRQKGAPYRHAQLHELFTLGRGVVGGDLNLVPRDAASAYKGRDECDPRNRWTYVTRKRKIDYLFAGDGRIRGCFVDYGRSGWSDHVPMHVWVAR